MKVNGANKTKFTPQNVYPSNCLIMKTKKDGQTQHLDKHVFKYSINKTYIKTCKRKVKPGSLFIVLPLRTFEEKWYQVNKKSYSNTLLFTKQDSRLGSNSVCK